MEPPLKLRFRRLGHLLAPGRVCHSTLLLSSWPVTGGAFPTASGFGRFPPFAGDRKNAHKPLTL